jgi:hypothetical protein
MHHISAALSSLSLLSILCARLLSAQPSQDKILEQQVRALEQTQVKLLLEGDINGMQKSWATDYVVNNPFNQTVDASAGPIRQGRLTYSSFARDIERVLIHGTTAIVMGSETVVPSGVSADAGKTIHRRFTDVWMNREGRWLLTARHANAICEHPPA